jgi:hypothetical protein
MDGKVWNAPVSLEMFGPGHYRIVTSAKEAAKVLCNEWPRRSGPKYSEALASCAASLKGEVDPERTRADFIHAAEEARINIVYS